MSFIVEGIRLFFSWILKEAKNCLYYKLEVKTGRREFFEFKNFYEFSRALRNDEIIGEADVKINNVCLSNFAPLYLCYQETFDEIENRIRIEGEEARQLYSSLRQKYDVPESVSLFVEAAKGRIKIDSLFREYADVKKFRFMGLSLVRFGPLTENLCYAAIFRSGEKLRNHTAPLVKDVHLEPFVPLFYDISIPRGIQTHSYVDVELFGKAMPLPTSWGDLLEKRRIKVHQRPYCLYVPNQEPYYINPIGLQTWMSLDAWISFYLPKKKLELPFFHRFEPTDDDSRQSVCDGFGKIFNSLLSENKTKITFYSDYVQPFIKREQPVLDMKTLRKLVSSN